MLWYNIEHKKPIATESGCWDGLRSDLILVATRNRKIHIVNMYEGIIDGTAFCNFYDQKDYEIENITKWAEIDIPF